MRRRTRKLSSQIFLAQLAILMTTMCVGFVLLARAERAQLDSEYEHRAAATALTVASMPTVQQCLATPSDTCRSEVQRIAAQVTEHTGSAYVVVIDMHRVRFSHPNPQLIGQQVGEQIATADGQVHLGIDMGATGRSANGKAPLYAPTGAMVGEVSVGLRESSVSRALWGELPSWAMWFAIALGIGALASLGLASHLKRRTFGLELDEIARLLQEREAALHGIREGLIAFDEDGRVSVVNDEAHALLDLPNSPVGLQMADAVRDERLRTRLSVAGRIEDEIIFTEHLCLVVNRMPVKLGGRPHGSVITLRDRTRLIGLRSELAGERGLTDSMRAQQHEFANRIHAAAGLIQLGRSDEALAYLLEIRGTAAEFDSTLREQVGSPQIVGLLLGKAAVASEAGVELTIAPETWLSKSPRNVQLLVSIIGNLVDNAIQAVATAPVPRRVTVSIVEDRAITIVVSDNGPGVPTGSEHRVFTDGYTTKAGDRRGLGLAIVERIVTRLGGTVQVANTPGATFTVSLPATPEPAPGRNVRTP